MFFEQALASDPIYRRVRDYVVPREREGRAFIEHLWGNVAEFVDSNLAKRAPTNGLVSSFCELYCAYALKRGGVGLVPRNKRTPRNQGPDLFARWPDVWIEAVAATPGTGPDALEWGHGQVPNDKFILRLREVIAKKVRQLKNHIELGYVRPGQSTVIAISGAMLPYRYSEALVPRVVRALFGIGDLVLEFDRAATECVGRSLRYQDEVMKARNSPVKTDVFLGSECSHVSAVMYSPSCWVHHPTTPGAEFVTVHNPSATQPLPDGWFPLGDEYWLHGSELRHTRHPVNAWQ